MGGNTVWCKLRQLAVVRTLVEHQVRTQSAPRQARSCRTSSRWSPRHAQLVDHPRLPLYHCRMPVCRNCQSSLDGEFCSTCGQRNVDLERPIWNLVGDVVRETFEVDGRAASTVKTLFRHPGMLTAEFLAGRRAAYTPPLRLYLVFSIVFFVLIAWFATSGILREPGADPGFDAAVQARFLSDELPTLMFMLLPAFALLMKIVYWNRLYFDHLIFSLHLHCVAYVALAIMLPLEVLASRHIILLLVQVVVFTAFLAYFIVAAHRVYQSGWLAVVLRAAVTLSMYIIIVSVAIEATSEFAIISD